MISRLLAPLHGAARHGDAYPGVMEEYLGTNEKEGLIVQYRALKAALEPPASAMEGAQRVLNQDPS